MDVALNVEITNHIKAGNTQEAKIKIEMLAEFEKLQAIRRINSILKNAKHLGSGDVHALSEKKRLIEESLNNSKKK